MRDLSAAQTGEVGSRAVIASRAGGDRGVRELADGEMEKGRLACGKRPWRRWWLLLQGGEIGAKVDMKDGTIDHQCRHGFNADGFGVFQPHSVFAEMDYLNRETGRIKGMGQVLFRIDADRATCVVKNGFALHTALLVGWTLCSMHSCMLGTAPPPAQRALFGTRLTFWCNFLKMKAIKKSSTASRYHQLEDVVGCKWSVSVLQAVGAGICRPGALERHIQGISTKVLAERLRKLTDYGLLNKHVFAELPPRTEYVLTTTGHKLVTIISQIKQLDDDIKNA